MTGVTGERRGEPLAPRSPDPARAAAALGFDYELPAERIAQEPARERDAARLLVVERGSGATPRDAIVRDLPDLLAPGDLLVVNRSRVIPARLRGRRLPGGGALEILLVAPVALPASARATTGGARWRAMARPARRLRPGQRVALDPPAGRAESEAVEAQVVGKGEGWIDLEFAAGADVLAIAQRHGETPLPPYIERPTGPTAADVERYQTVYAAEPGSIAAPTAGLHLTDRLLAALRARGIGVAEVVLHVGPATFLAGQPGRDLLALEPERYAISAATRSAIEAATGRVVAVGTTSTRALEAAARAGWPEGEANTDLVLRPGDPFAVVQGLLTNFHLPGSSLLALVSAFAGVETARAAYAAALERGYRFYSFGDAMLIL